MNSVFNFLLLVQFLVPPFIFFNLLYFDLTVVCKVLSLGLWLARSCGIICSAESLASPGSLSCWALSRFVLFGDLGVPLTSVQGRSFPASLVKGASHVSSQGPDVVCCVSTFVLTCSQVTAWALSITEGGPWREPQPSPTYSQSHTVRRDQC